MLRLKLRSTGRGRRFTPLRGAIETVLGVAYVGEWPARVWRRVPGATRVDLLEHVLPLLPSAPLSVSVGAASAARRPLRIGFASDLHVGPTTPAATLDHAFALLAAAAPDVLLLGGDYVYLDVTPAHARRLAALVGSVPARLKLAVLGNHDLWTEHALIEAALRDGGARVLVNETAALPPPWDDVAVVGLDDPWTGVGDPEAAFQAPAARAARLRVVLCHAPEGWPAVRGRNVGLMLCGHTHGGQVALPWGPIVVHGHFGRQWPSGLRSVEGTSLFVSRGIGGAELPIRLFARPDVSIFTLTETAPAI